MSTGVDKVVFELDEEWRAMGDGQWANMVDRFR
jgi:hypothetical protein